MVNEITQGRLLSSGAVNAKFFHKPLSKISSLPDNFTFKTGKSSDPFNNQERQKLCIDAPDKENRGYNLLHLLWND